MNESRDETLAIVVALTDPALPSFEQALARFVEEAGQGGEVLLVDASGSRNGASLAERYANVRVIPRPFGWLAPNLWRDGLLATNADLVAFSTAQMFPSRGWIEALKARMEDTGAAGVGGPIAPGPGLSATDQAVALLRYANYFPSPSQSNPPGDNALNSFPRSAWECSHRRSASVAPCATPLGTQSVGTREESNFEGHRSFHAPHPQTLSHRERGARRDTSRNVQPPGDNALYRRDALMAVEASWIDGFWEVEVHKALCDRGESLAMDPQAVVTFVGGTGWAMMAVQRFRHARRYGRGRSSGLGAMTRLYRAAAAPLVPPLLCMRIIQALRARRIALAPWLPALVPLVGLAVCWAIGEAVGTLSEDRILEPMPQQFHEVM